MRRRILLAVVLIFGPVIHSTAQVDTTATIVGWNLKGFDPIADRRLPNLARVIADLDPEVIALAEVNPMM